MNKRILTLLLTTLCLLTATGCTQTKETKVEETNKKEPETVKEVEETPQIDIERYQAYITVLENIIENNQWPNGNAVLGDTFFGPISDNQFAICDVDQDEKEELLVRITNTDMAGMIEIVFEYDAATNQVIEQWTTWPGVIYYNNGITHIEASHNHTEGEAIWPFTLCQYNAQKDTFEYVGGAYCQDREWTFGTFPDAEDLDGDGVIYYISDSNNEDKSATKEEYDAWLNSYLGDAKKLYIPYERLSFDNIELLQQLVDTKGAIKSINLVLEETILEYDITGDGEEDAILIHCEERDEYSDWGDFGYRWSVSINGRNAYEIQNVGSVMLEARLYQINDKRSYLSIKQHEQNNNDISNYALYRASENQLEEVCNFYDDILDSSHNFHYGAQLLAMKKDSFKLRCSNQFNATASMVWDMEYEYKDDKWILSKNEHPFVHELLAEDKRDGMTANQDFIVYKSITCDEEAFTVTKGQVVTIDKIYIKDGFICFKVTNAEGKEGWLPDPEESFTEMNGEWLNGYFEEAMFAG